MIIANLILESTHRILLSFPGPPDLVRGQASRGIQSKEPVHMSTKFITVIYLFINVIDAGRQSLRVWPQVKSAVPFLISKTRISVESRSLYESRRASFRALGTGQSFNPLSPFEVMFKACPRSKSEGGRDLTPCDLDFVTNFMIMNTDVEIQC